MLVTPSVNVKTFEEVSEKVSAASKVMTEDSWIHLDVCDGVFTPAVTWNNPSEFKKLMQDSGLSADRFVVHLMVADPIAALKVWIAAGAKWFIVHEEAVASIRDVAKIAEEGGVNVAISITLKIDQLNPDLALFGSFQVLAVPPGFAGQKFNTDVLGKIKLLRAEFPNARIEIDGGINSETAKLVKDAGADTIVSASYIWNNANPRAAYDELSSV